MRCILDHNTCELAEFFGILGRERKRHFKKIISSLSLTYSSHTKRALYNLMNSLWKQFHHPFSEKSRTETLVNIMTALWFSSQKITYYQNVRPRPSTTRVSSELAKTTETSRFEISQHVCRFVPLAWRLRQGEDLSRTLLIYRLRCVRHKCPKSFMGERDLRAAENLFGKNPFSLSLSERNCMIYKIEE
jgi:hypothetical protein